MGPLLMLSAIACKVGTALLLNNTAKTRIKSRSGHYLFAAITSVVALIFVFVISKGKIVLSSHDVVHGIVLGVLSIGEEFFLLSALECGTMAMTYVAALSAVVIPILLKPLLWNEANGIWAYIGAVVIIIAMILIMTDSRAETEEEKHEFKHWKKYAILLFIITALVEIEEKTYVSNAIQLNNKGYYFVTYLTGIILAGGLFLYRFKGKNEPTHFSYDWKFILILIFVGIFKALIYFTIELAAEELTESVVAMLNRSCTLLIVTAFDVFVFKTKYRLKNYLAVIATIAGIALLHI